MRKIVCKICGKSFESNYSKAYYCSPQCRVIGYRDKRLEWEKENPGYAHEYYMKRKKEDNMNGLEELKQERAKLTEKIRRYEGSKTYTSSTKFEKRGSSRYPRYVVSVWGELRGGKRRWSPIISESEPSEVLKQLDTLIKELTELRADTAEMFKTKMRDSRGVFM